MGFRAAVRRLFSLADTNGAPYQPVRFSHSLLHGRGLLGTVTREQALSIPGIQRGRNMICSISTLPLAATGSDNRRRTHPLLTQYDDDVPNVVVMAQTIEDLLFESVAWWRVTSYDWTSDGYPVPASIQRYAPGNVSMQPPSDYQRGYLPSGLPTDGVVWMDGEPVLFKQVIRFDSPNPPILEVAARSIRRAMALDAAAEMYADSPRPMDYFTSSDPTADPAGDDIIAQVLTDWKAARKERSTAYVPVALKYNEVQQPTPADLQLVQLQQRVGLDVANALGIDPEDLGISTTSRTYQNGVDRRRDRINDVLSPYMSAVTDRLNMPDVTSPDTTIAFQLDNYLKADPKTRAEVQSIYVGMGVMSREYVARQEGLAPEDIPAAPMAPAAPRPAIQAGEAIVGEQMSRHRELTFNRHTVEFEAATTASFAIDAETRTITGLAVPWNQSATSNGKAYRFLPGSLKYAAVNRVKLLRDHNYTLAIGKAVKLVETEKGLEATFKVAEGARGDEALALALEEVLDGLSIGVDFREEHVSPDPQRPGGYVVSQAALREISLTPMPAFDDSRLTSVRASDEGVKMHTCDRCGTQLTPGVAHTCAGSGQFNADIAQEFATFMAARESGGKKDKAPITQEERNDAAVQAQRGDNEAAQRMDNMGAASLGDPEVERERNTRPGDPTSTAYVDEKHPAGRTGTATTWEGRSGDDKRATTNEHPPQDAQFSADLAAFMASRRRPVDPTGRRTGVTQVREALPYTFSRRAVNGDVQFSTSSPHNFHTDLLTMARSGDDGSKDTGQFTDAGKRVMGLIRAQFDVDTADVNELYPNIQRPDMFVDQRDYRRPIWDMIGRGDVPGGGVPFTFPKFSSASGLVGAHTEGTEPASGTYVTTDQTITPGAISGKASLTREVWTRPGNPATASLVWNQMVRGYWEAAESAAAAFLNTLTAATDIALTTGATGTTLTNQLENALAQLQLVRGYDFRAGVLEGALYGRLIEATDADGRKIYPILGPQNASGQSQTRYMGIDVAGYQMVPSWALASTPGASNNSWLFDPSTIYGWISAPERLEFPGTAPAGAGAYAPVAMVDLAIWGWRALANTDIGGVRQITYDTTV